MTRCPAKSGWQAQLCAVSVLRQVHLWGGGNER